MKISFRDLQESDFPKLRFDSGFPTKMHMALVDGQEFGYLQSDKVSSYPEFSEEISEKIIIQVSF
jgi:hypothetical protein